MKTKIIIPFLLFFLSGFTGLVYQVLWMKELRVLFGSTTYATSTTLCAFFLGLSVGSFYFGKRVENYTSTLLMYGVLELAVALSALLYFLLLKVYFVLYPFIFQSLSDLPAIFVSIKFIISISILFLPAFFMGGTLPLLSHHIVEKRELGAHNVAYLYATNTFGAAVGVLSAGFFLPRYFGFIGAYAIAVFLTAIVGLIALVFGRKEDGSISKKSGQQAKSRPLSEEVTSKGAEIRGLALLSGFLTLALQVLWTTMFAQTLQNSVYTFSLIVLCFLLALACGSLLAGFLARIKISEQAVISFVLLLSSVLVALTPFLFQYVTGDMGKVGGKSGFFDYLSLASFSIFVVLFLPTLAMGIVFPYLLKSTEALPESTGSSVGRVTAWNTAGAICGALVAGFVALPLLGLWPSIRFLAILFAVGGMYVCIVHELRRGIAFSVVTLLLLVSVLDPSRLPLVKIYPILKKDNLLEVWEGTDAVVAVVRRNDSLRIKVNNFYVLGSSGASKREEMQTHVPLMIHPDPKKVFYLGMGTGITAGAALSHPVEDVTVTEILPEVVEASRKYFKPYLNGLFENDKAEVLVEDGRNYIRGTDKEFDVIIGDLFLPWKAGVGDLYSRDHFQMAHKRLSPGGIYAQWIPLYQVSKEEFSIIANTMRQVFPRVTLWRRDFARSAGNARGEKGTSRENTFLGHYCGNLSVAKNLVESSPINTDDFPVIEYLSPRTHRNRHNNKGGLMAASWFTDQPLTDFLGELLSLSLPGVDPYLVKVPEQEKGMVAKGLGVFSAEVVRRAPAS